MWLEEMVWLWMPAAGGFGIWVVWSYLILKAEVQTLRHRLEQIEGMATSRGNEERRVA